MDLNQQRKYIYHKITSLKDTSDLYHIIDKMDIPKTSNANGIFMNLSALPPEDIQNLYGVMETIHIHKEEFIPDIGHLSGPPSVESLGNISENQPKVKPPPVKKVKLTSLQKTILSYKSL